MSTTRPQPDREPDASTQSAPGTSSTQSTPSTPSASSPVDVHGETTDPTPEPFSFPTLRTDEVVLLLCLPLTVVVALAGLLLTGELAPSVFGGPGDLVTYGLPAARALHDALAAVTIGLLLLATFVLPGQRELPGIVSYSQWTAARWAARAAAGWLAAALAVLVLTTADAIGAPLTSPGFGGQLRYFATGIELGQTMVVSAACVAVALVVLLASRKVSWVAVACALSVVALLPLSLSGHAAGADEHANAVNSLAIHLVGVTAWVGGLTGLVLLRRRVGPHLATVVARYSTLAGWAFVAVAFSGVVNASLRLDGLDDLATPYGMLLVGKTVALCLLGLAGWAQRRRILPQLRDPARSSRAFVRLAVTEVVVMATTMGASVALSRSAPPVPQNPVVGDPRHALLGFPYPAPVSTRNMLTQVHVDWAWLALVCVLAGGYVACVVRLRRRGDAWPLGRTVSWLLGCLVLAYVTSGGPAVYGSVHFSTHMIQHMGLMMFAPLPLVLGGPVLLLLRVLPHRSDASRGPREWILVVVHSRYMQVLSKPPVAGVIFAGSLVAFYYTGWFDFALFKHQGHVLMQVHFLASGYLFFWMLVGVDPGPPKASPPIRLVVLLVTMAFHAFFGVAVMESTTLLAPDWWRAMGGDDQAALLVDQQTGGGIAWGAGELPVVLAALIVVFQWTRSDARDAKRYDRQAERDGDAELEAYNARLAAMGRQAEQQG